MTKLIEILQERQNSDRLTDVAFAKKLQVSRRLWGRTRDGNIPIGLTLLKGIFRVYENDADVIDAVTAFLRDNHRKEDSLV